MKKLLLLVLAILVCFSVSACALLDNLNTVTSSSSVDSSSAESVTNEAVVSSPVSSQQKTESTPSSVLSEIVSSPKPHTVVSSNQITGGDNQIVNTKPTSPAVTVTKPTNTPPKQEVNQNGNTVNNEDIGAVEEVVGKPTIKEEEAAPPISENVTVVTSHTPLKVSEYYQYASMPAAQRSAYNKIRDGIAATKNIIDVTSENLSYDDALGAVQMVLADNPQFFWVAKSLSLFFDAGDKVTSVVLYYSDGENMDSLDSNYKVIVGADRAKIENQITEFNAKAKQILDSIPVSASPINKEKMIFDYIVKNTDYDAETASKEIDYTKPPNRCFDAYGAAVKNLAVCEGYAKLFQYLCYQVGINCTQVTGISMDINHMWNAIKIENEWYNVDVTWADGYSNNKIYYGYFNITDEEISPNHTVVADKIYIPKCTATKNSFYNTLCGKVVSTFASPENYKTVVDNLNIDGEYFIIYLNNKELSVSYLSNYICAPSSDVQKYISSSNANFKLKYVYYSIGQYVYIPIERK